MTWQRQYRSFHGLTTAEFLQKCGQWDEAGTVFLMIAMKFD